jgi:hypothetical protein
MIINKNHNYTEQPMKKLRAESLTIGLLLLLRRIVFFAWRLRLHLRRMLLLRHVHPLIAISGMEVRRRRAIRHGVSIVLGRFQHGALRGGHVHATTHRGSIEGGGTSISTAAHGVGESTTTHTSRTSAPSHATERVALSATAHGMILELLSGYA